MHVYMDESKGMPLLVCHNIRNMHTACVALTGPSRKRRFGVRGRRVR